MQELNQNQIPKYKVDQVIRAEWDDKCIKAKIDSVKVYEKLDFIGYKTDTNQHFREEELSTDIRVGDIVKGSITESYKLVTETGEETANTVSVEVVNNGFYMLLTDSEIEELSEGVMCSFVNSIKFAEKNFKTSDTVKFGDIVLLETHQLKIKELKLRELQEKYGVCLSRKQMNSVQNENYENDIDSDLMDISYEDLEITKTTEQIGIISGINNLFGYYFNGYSEHTPGFGSAQFCQTYEDKRSITIDNIGVDFEDYFIYTKPRIVKVISPKEIADLKFNNKQKEFFGL